MAEATITIDQGQLQGKIAKDLYGNDYYSFQGIPFAKPPIGELRFKAPQAPEPWTGIRDATFERSECYARHLIYREKIVGAEDCLYLNVYTPKLPKDNSSLKPVMVWIHGGAFTLGSSKTEIYSPDYLITEDVVLVTINYRLGILGFLSLNDTSLGVPGNAACKDMVMALKWVQKNIKNFSGDPNNVTIFGESAGGASVHYLILSPMAKGLFHRAISQSGCALNPWAQGRNFSADLATILQINPSNEKELLKELQNLSIEKLHEIAEKVFDGFVGEEILPSSVRRAYAPIVEKPSNEEGFLLENPLDIIRNEKYNKVPFMAGFTNNEGLLLKIVVTPNDIKFTNNFELAIPYFYNLPTGSKLSKTVADKIKQFYVNENLNPVEKRERYFMLQSDTFFIRDICKVVKMHAANSPNPVYLYKISVETELNFQKKMGASSETGVAHGDDVGYLFKTAVSPEIKSNSIEEISVKRFVRFWTNFARYGDPNPKTKDPLINIAWKPVKKNELNFIDLGKELTLGVNPEADRIAFWEDIEKFVEIAEK